MNKITNILGSTALAMVLFTGCGENPLGETKVGTNNSSGTSNVNYLKSIEASNIGNQLAMLSPLSSSSENILGNKAPSRAAQNINELKDDINNALSTKTTTNKEDLNKLKVALVSNPNITNDKALEIVTKVADTLIGTNINGKIVTQSDVDLFLSDVDSGGLYFMSIMEAYAKYQNDKSPGTIHIDEVSLNISKSPRRSVLSKLTNIDLLGGVKEGLVDLISTDVVTDLTADAFRLALKSGTVTEAMLDLAIASETITDIMVTVMQDNWDLTEPMIPMMLDPKDNYSFTRKFLILANSYDKQIAEMTFTYIDVPMYDAITKVMALSPEVNKMMGETMVAVGVNHFLIPDEKYSIQRKDKIDSYASLYAGKDAFARLMLDPENGLINERMFYSLFATSETTEAFVNTMKQVKDTDSGVTSTFFMDNIFVGGSIEENAMSIDDIHKEQSMKNIYAIAKAMLDGVNKEGFDNYSKSFIGFAGLVPFDRYLPYGKAFGTAGYYYATANNIDIPFGSIGGWLSNTLFNTDTVDTSIDTKQAAPRQAVSLSYFSDILDMFSEFFSNAFNSLEEVKDYISTSSVGAAIAKTFDSVLESGTVAVDAFVEELKTKAHSEIENQIQIVIADANYTLPPFDILSLDYMIESTKTTASLIIEDPSTVRQFTDNARVQEVYDFVNSKLETNVVLGYIPIWLTKLDYLELPANIDAMPSPILNFASGSVDIYILSDNADLIDLQTNVLGNNVLLTEIAIEDSPLTVQDGEINEMHVYKFTIKASDLINVNTIMSSIGSYFIDNEGTVAIDASDAIVEPTVLP